MILSQKTLSSVDQSKVNIPDNTILKLPERVLQFGTGVLLRGLPDYFIDKANRQNIFNGRIVAVKSTDSGDITAFEPQNNLFTLCIRGLENGKTVEQNKIISSVSRVISAKNDWNKILECAANPDLQIIISNTTEVGIQFIKEDIQQAPPTSFPAKLLSFLHERYKVFGDKKGSGFIIIPTELIVDNGKKLKLILIDLARENSLEEPFIEWLKIDNHFCNSLVDRIVPGKPGKEKLEEIHKALGYKDDLLIIAEPYCLWAIEGNSYVKNILSFSIADNRVIVTDNINRFRELKLRLLNATHTLSCGLAHLAGFTYVIDAMENQNFLAFVKNVMLSEIASAIPLYISPDEVNNFGKQVIERFLNPYIKHQWLNITLNYTSKMKARVVPMLLEYFKKYKTVPQNIALGFAAFLLFMKAVKKEDKKYYGIHEEDFYFINDDQASYFYTLWQNKKPETVVNEVLQNKNIWDEDLTLLQGFPEAVINKLNILIDHGSLAAIKDLKKLFHK